MRIALFEPDIPQNAGAIFRLGAALGVPVDIIGPCGFLLSDSRLRRAGMDYLDKAVIEHHASWTAFAEMPRGGRLILLTTKALQAYTTYAFEPNDTLLLGRESAGVPAFVHEAAAARLCIPLRAGLRSLNVAQAAAMVLGEALRQTSGFPQ